MQLHELVEQVVGFDKLPPREKIRLFAWYLHAHKGVEHFDYDAIRSCYREIHLVPDDIGKYVTRMTSVKPADLVRERPGFKLTRTIRTQLDGKYGTHYSVAAVSKILSELPAQVPNLAEKTFLAEALKCYRIEAYRSCIVMTWNLAYAHLLDWILNDVTRLAAFNSAITKRYPKKVGLTVSNYDQFLDDLKEREVVEICNAGSLFNSNIFRILKEKLDRRNIVAHPSTVVVVQSQADDVVTDLVNNVVLTLT